MLSSYLGSHHNVTSLSFPQGPYQKNFPLLGRNFPGKSLIFLNNETQAVKEYSEDVTFLTGSQVGTADTEDA
jgi:hypothetical protein